MQDITLYTTAVQSPSQYQWHGKQWHQLPEFIPSNSNSDLHIYSSLNARVWHVLTSNDTVSPATRTCIHKWRQPCLLLHPSCRASSPLSSYRYSFPVLLRTLGWIGLSGWLRYQSGMPNKHGRPSQCYWARHRVTSLIETNAIPLWMVKNGHW